MFCGSLFDDNEARYKKIKTHINEFVIVQFGISVFYVNADSTEYTCDVFTVYLFPRTSGRKDTSLKFQASSLEFLSRYNFDFNKVDSATYII
jgi:poly(A)-specific ribonuclease